MSNKFLKFVRALVLATYCLSPSLVFAQSSPSPVFYYGFVPTAGQWNAYFQAKQDYLGYTPVNPAGGTFTGKVYTMPSSIALAGLNIGVGTAPTAPQNGDLWITSSGLFTYIGGVTYGPYLGGLSGDVLISGVNLATIQPNVVTYAKEAQSGSNTVVGNASSATANKSDLSVPSCSGASQALIWTTNSGFGCATITAGSPATNGRLTNSSGTPVPSGAVLAAANVYYTPYNGNQIALWNGSAFVNNSFSQLTNILANSSVGNAGPAAAAASSVYDLFVWNNGGTPTLTRGPAWTNITTRSAGTAISQVNGIYVNSIAITNGPAIGYGTYVGTVSTDASGATVTYNPTPAAASGGPTGGAWVGLWNYYNRVPLLAVEKDSKATWTGVSGAADASTNNRVTTVVGVVDDSVSANYTILVGVNNSYAIAGIGVNNNTLVGTWSDNGYSTATGMQTQAFGRYDSFNLLGENYYQAVENASGTVIFNGSQFYQLTLNSRY